MKLISILLLLVFISGCASRDVKKGPCDGIANRENRFVCGDKDVVKDCNRVLDTDEFVCKSI